MSSRRTKPQPLSDSEIRQIATDIEAGRPPMVWFTAAAVGVPEGRSGKVLALGDPSEGDFLQIKPTGSKDVMAFGPTEVTLIKPARPQKDAAAGKKATAAKAAAAATTTDAKPPVAKPTTATRKDSTVTMSSPATMPSAQPSASPTPDPAAAQPGSGPEPAGTAATSNNDTGKAAKPAGSRPARNAAAASRKAKAPEVTVTLSGTADGEWTLDVVNGKKRTIRGLSVPSSSVAQAAKILHPEVAEVVDSVLEAVRGAQRAKVEQLQAELENARRLLDELGSN
ncbi:DUF6319 family protein [Nocardia otitidiscaviarum]|uniref:Cell wall anchor protein n=1 Tax=Nocardia otitidiscaviarum TaxID=1823 RepID=A0A516NGY2_9NOCA|nr:DUF6319 family protein [Nocardia otitidiscaviarum]MBF6177796.1 hypothetical protein [Nocardia otitidiscaviarum]QDP78156.1 hypothetical protein FOH10_04800 [Nocardia otitidiscaviarum]